MTRTWMGAVCALLLLAAPAAARDQDDGGRDRHWALGWEDGVTLRRDLGLWDVSVSAGPQDWLDNSDRYSWNTEWPDSLQGQVTSSYDDHHESGFVRLTVARQLGAWDDFTLHATGAGAYTWSNANGTSVHWYSSQPEPDRRVTASHEDAWAAALGFRLAWRPLPYLGLHTRLGVILRSETGWRTETYRDGADGGITSYEEPYRSLTFNDYGATGTGSIEFFVWF